MIKNKESFQEELLKNGVFKNKVILHKIEYNLNIGNFEIIYNLSLN